jgi:hypothetical protein
MTCQPPRRASSPYRTLCSWWRLQGAQASQLAVAAWGQVLQVRTHALHAWAPSVAIPGRRMQGLSSLCDCSCELFCVLVRFCTKSMQDTARARVVDVGAGVTGHLGEQTAAARPVVGATAGLESSELGYGSPALHSKQ